MKPFLQNQEADALDDAEAEGTTALHVLRLSILEKLVQHVPQLKNVGGVTSIPFMQVSISNFGIFCNIKFSSTKRFRQIEVRSSCNQIFELNVMTCCAGCADVDFRIGWRGGERQSVFGESPQRYSCPPVHEQSRHIRHLH